MNFERIDNDIYNGHAIKLEQKDAVKYLFYLIRCNAHEAVKDEYEQDFYIEIINELNEYLGLIMNNGWKVVTIVPHPMAVSQIIVKEGETIWT